MTTKYIINCGHVHKQDRSNDINTNFYSCIEHFAARVVKTFLQTADDWDHVPRIIHYLMVEIIQIESRLYRLTEEEFKEFVSYYAKCKKNNNTECMIMRSSSTTLFEICYHEFRSLIGWFDDIPYSYDYEYSKKIGNEFRIKLTDVIDRTGRFIVNGLRLGEWKYDNDIKIYQGLLDTTKGVWSKQMSGKLRKDMGYAAAMWTVSVTPNSLRITDLRIKYPDKCTEHCEALKCCDACKNTKDEKWSVNNGHKRFQTWAGENNYALIIERWIHKNPPITIDDVMAIFKSIEGQYTVENGNVKWAVPDLFQYNWFARALEKDKNYKGNYYYYNLTKTGTVSYYTVEPTAPWSICAACNDSIISDFNEYIYMIFINNEPNM